MNADGLAELRRMAEQARDLADNHAPLAALARLEAAEAELDEYSTDVGYAAGYEDGKKYAVAQRDALAQALRKLANPTHEPKGEEAVLVQIEVAGIARAALAEAGL